MAELQQHGPLSTSHLAAGVKQRLNSDAIKITGYVIAQNAARLEMVEGTPRKGHGSIWRIIGDERYQAMPQRRKCYVTNIGMDAEHLAWMAEYAAKRTQRGNCQDLAAAVLNQRGTQ